MPPPLPPGGIAFTHELAVAPLNIHAKSFVAARPLIAGAATGALVFSRATGEDRVLLIQRAAHDSMPLRWEIPGGACDMEDETMLHGLARELWEESGLRLRNVVRQVGDERVFLTRRGLGVVKVVLEADVEVETAEGEEVVPQVVLDPNEHARFLWATEEECRAGKVAALSSTGESEVVDIQFTTADERAVILLGLQLRREETATATAAATAA
jgi:8-oxo-dGTP pyrophosphatase MutT (NUDIX family)